MNVQPNILRIIKTYEVRNDPEGKGLRIITQS